MNRIEDINQIEAIRELLQKGKVKDALNKLLEFANSLEDKELKNLIVATSARFNINLRKKNLGIEEEGKELNSII